VSFFTERIGCGSFAARETCWAVQSLKLGVALNTYEDRGREITRPASTASASPQAQLHPSSHPGQEKKSNIADTQKHISR
jgi:hypothetical protein